MFWLFALSFIYCFVSWYCVSFFGVDIVRCTCCWCVVLCSCFLNLLWVSIGFVRCPWSCFRSKKSNGKQRTRIWKNKNNTNLQDHSRTNQQRKNQARIKNLELRTHSVTKNIQQHTDKTTRTTLNEFGLLFVSFVLFCFLKLCFWVLIILCALAVGAMSFANVQCFYCWGFLAFVFPDLGFVLENQMEQRTRIWNK